MERLGAIDRNFYSIDTPTTRQIIGLACKLDRFPEKEIVANSLARVVEQFPRLKQKLRGDAFSAALKIDDNFSIANHFSLLNVPLATTFEQAVSILFSKYVGDDLSPWKLIVFKYGDGAYSQSGMVLLIHHALADGLGVLRVFLSIVDGEDSFPSVPAAKIFNKKRGDGSRLAPVIRSLRQLAKECFDCPKRTLLNGENSASRQLVLAEISLDDFSKFARESGGSLNDLYLAVVSDSVARYHNHFGVALGSTRAIMPVNLRSSNDTNLGNNLTGVGVMLPGGEGSLSEKVMSVRRSVGLLKDNAAIGAYYLLAQLTARLPNFLRRIVCEVAATRTNFICTNVPGPTKQLNFCGADILEYYGLPALMRGHGAAFCFFTSKRSAFFSIVIDPQIVANKEILERSLAQSLEIISPSSIKFISA